MSTIVTTRSANTTRDAADIRSRDAANSAIAAAFSGPSAMRGRFGEARGLAAEAQTTGGGLRGHVKDDQGGALPGVAVTAKSPDMVQPATGITDGEFQKAMPLAARRNWTDFLEQTPGVHSRPFDDGSGRSVYFGHATEHFAHVVQLEIAANIYNVFNGGNYTQYNYNSAYQSWSSNFLLMANQQPARAFQLTVVGRF